MRILKRTAQRSALLPTRKSADIILKVRRPSASELKCYKKGAAVIAMMDPYGRNDDVKAMADAGVSAFAMEFMPRITRAQVMDVLSSQANLAGYQAVIDAASEYDRALPMMMTAAGTVPRPRYSSWARASPACRPSPPRAVLAALSPPPTCAPPPRSRSPRSARSSSRSRTTSSRRRRRQRGYAKEMSKEYQAKQAALVAEHIAKQDIVITTALIPGRPAPRLVTKQMLSAMKAGSVVVDLAVERGGNVEGSEAGQGRRLSAASRLSATTMCRAASRRPLRCCMRRTCSRFSRQ